MKQGDVYIKGNGDFLKKLRVVDGMPKGAILFIADVVGLYPSLPHAGGLELLQKQYDKFKDKIYPFEDIIKMTGFVLKNNLFEFDCKFYQQISGTAMGPNLRRRMLVFLWTILKLYHKTLVMEKIR